MDPHISEMVQRKTLVPRDKLPTVVLGLLTLVTVPEPTITDQLPVPEKAAGAFAASVAVGTLIQIVCVTPAVDVVAILSTRMLIVELVVAHIPFVMLHLKTLIPAEIALTAVLLASVLLIVAAPLTSDQLPAPLLGVFAASTVEVEEMQRV